MASESFPKYSFLINSDMVFLQKLREGWVVTGSRTATSAEISGNSAKAIGATQHTTVAS
jgi:hypothetical protein